MSKVIEGQSASPPAAKSFEETRHKNKNENIRRIKDRIASICSQYGIEHMFIFGSQARGEATAKSDVDFFLDKPGAISSLLTLSGFRLDLEECLGLEVDLITALEEDSFFGKEVIRDRVTVYGS